MSTPLFTLDTHRQVKYIPIYPQPPSSLKSTVSSELRQRKSREGPNYREHTESQLADKFPAAEHGGKVWPRTPRGEDNAGAELKEKVGKARLAEERQRGEANSWLGQILLFQTSPQPRRVNKLAVCLIYGVHHWLDGHYCD